MNIGKYILDRMNDGRWIVYWTDHISHYRNQVIIDDLEKVMDNIFKTPHDIKKAEFIDMFRTAMTNPDKFLDNPLAHDLLKHLPNVTNLPGNIKASKDRFNWYLGQFIEAYASMTGTRFSPTEIDLQVADLKDQV